MGRALHALLYAQELHEAGHEVKIIFDGAGTIWIKKFEDPANDFHPVYRAAKELGVIGGACEFCSGAFGVGNEVRESGINVLSERNGHPSLAKLVAEDYQIITL